MCLGANYWWRISIGSTLSVSCRDAAGIEFRDEFIYEELAKPFEERALPMVHVSCDGALKCLRRLEHLAGRVTY